MYEVEEDRGNVLKRRKKGASHPHAKHSVFAEILYDHADAISDIIVQQESMVTTSWDGRYEHTHVVCVSGN